MVSCSCFAPTPSMAAMLVNRFRFREDVLTYNLSGMGCSSSLVCVDLAKHLLKVCACWLTCSSWQQCSSCADQAGSSALHVLL